MTVILMPPSSDMAHVVPRSRGGSDDPENLVTACWTCNCKKADREPHEAGMDVLKVGGRDV